MEDKEVKYSIPNNHNIFESLISEDQYSQDQFCSICDQKFNFLNLKKNCKFCGNAICVNHSKAKRQNPSNKSTKQFVRICDQCNQKYLEQMLQKYYEEEKSLNLKNITELTTQLKTIEDQIQIKQQILDDYSLSQQEKEKGYNEELLHKKQKIEFYKKQIKKIKEKNKHIQEKEIEKLKYKINQIKTNLKFYSDDYAKLKTQVSEKGYMISAINLDIKQTMDLIEDIQLQIDSYKPRKGRFEKKEKPLNSSQIPSFQTQSQAIVVPNTQLNDITNDTTATESEIFSMKQQQKNKGDDYLAQQKKDDKKYQDDEHPNDGTCNQTCSNNCLIY